MSGSENDTSILAAGVSGTPMRRGAPSTVQRRNNVSEGPRLTALLLTVSFTFLLLTLPNNIVMIVTRVWNHARPYRSIYQDMATFSLIKAITQLLMYMNHSVNFFLYCATGNKFRQQILELCRCARPARAPNTSLSNTLSIKRHSHMLGGGAGEVLVALRSDRRRSSSFSTDLAGSTHDAGADTGRGGVIKPNLGGGKSMASALRLDTLKLNSDTNGNDMGSGKSRNVCATQRNDLVKSNGNSRICYGYSRSRASEDKVAEGGRFEDRNSPVSRRTNTGCRLFFNSKRNRFSCVPPSRSFGDDLDARAKDREYILLQPTIRWCEASVQS